MKRTEMENMERCHRKMTDGWGAAGETCGGHLDLMF